MNTNHFSACMIALSVVLFTFSSCKDQQEVTRPHSSIIKSTKEKYTKMVSENEEIGDTKEETTKTAGRPVLNKLAKKYGVSSKVFKATEVDRIPLFDISCLSKKDPEACSSDKLNDFVVTHIKYQNQEVSKGNEGYELAHFVVDRDGSIADKKLITTIKHSCKTCKQSALDIFDKMEKWVPAKKDGKYVAVEMAVPIRFEIQDY